MLQLDEPDDFVISSGEHHSVRELLDTAFSRVGMDWKDHVVVDKHLFRPQDVASLKGNSSKAERVLGWIPKTKFRETVETMVDADLKRWKDALAGRVFPWDIPGSIDFSSVAKLQTKR